MMTRRTYTFVIDPPGLSKTCAECAARARHNDLTRHFVGRRCAVHGVCRVA